MEISPESTLHLGIFLIVQDTIKVIELTNDIKYYHIIPCAIFQIDSFNPSVSSTLYCTTVLNNLAVSILINNASVVI